MARLSPKQSRDVQGYFLKVYDFRSLTASALVPGLKPFTWRTYASTLMYSTGLRPPGLVCGMVLDMMKWKSSRLLVAHFWKNMGPASFGAPPLLNFVP